MSLTYYLVARRWPLLREHPLACGAGYGLVLYGIMNFVVVPLSAASGGSKDPFWVALSVAVHMLFIGIPIALFSRLALEQAPRTAPESDQLRARRSWGPCSSSSPWRSASSPGCAR